MKREDDDGQPLEVRQSHTTTVLGGENAARGGGPFNRPPEKETDLTKLNDARRPPSLPRAPGSSFQAWMMRCFRVDETTY